MSPVFAPKGLAQADFLGAPLGGKRRQPEQSQRRDEDGDAHEQAKDIALLLVGAKLLLEKPVHEKPVDGDGGREPVPVRSMAESAWGTAPAGTRTEIARLASGS